MLQPKDKISIFQEYIRLEEERAKMGLKGHLDAFLDYSEFCIRSDYDKGGSKPNTKAKKRKNQLTEQELSAFNELSSAQKLAMYIRIVRFIRDVRENCFEHENRFGNLETTEGYTRSYNLKIWKKKTLKLDRSIHHIFGMRDDKLKAYDLNNYVMRESKNKDYFCFVLQAINTKPHHKARTVHIGFKEKKLFQAWYNSVQQGVAECQRIRILRELGIEPYEFLGVANRSMIIQNDERIKKAQEHEEETEILSELKPEKMSMPSRPASKRYFDTQPNFGPKMTDISDIGEAPSGNKDIPQIQQSNVLEEFNHEQADLKDIETITKQLLDEEGENQTLQEIQEKQQKIEQKDSKKNLNLFHQILPQYQLQTLPDETGYDLISNQNQIRIFRHHEHLQKYKFFMTLAEKNLERVFDPIAHIDTYTKWNTAIEEVSIKNLIRSENTAIIYQKHKAYSKIYRARDFIFLRHVFKKDNCLFMVDKPFENANCPPFMTIVRGEIQAVWGIYPKSDGTLVIADLDIKNQGYLNQAQDHNLSLVYLKGLSLMPSYLTQKGFNKDQEVSHIFDLDWDIANNEKNVIVEQYRQRRKTIVQESQQRESQLFKAISQDRRQQQKNMMEVPQQQTLVTQTSFKKKSNAEEGEATPQKVKIKVEELPSPKEKVKVEIKESKNPQESKAKVEVIVEKSNTKEVIKVEQKKEETRSAQKLEDQGEIDFISQPVETHIAIKYNFDPEGLVIIPQDHLKHRFIFTAQSSSPQLLQEVIKGHAIWKGQWIFDKAGGIIFIDEKKIQDQKGVLKFILTKIGKNLLSGKSILNISLPVDIFAGQSNLQRFAFGMTYAPMCLQKAAKEKNILQKMRYAVAFGITNSVLYLNMEKPFNPILGQTFQGWVNGCPVYLEQISHHPPIAAFMFFGRGYKITGCLESKIQLHMNSGCGITDGVYKIQFDDGTDICFVCPGGQVSGLTYGDRKFNLTGKSYYWSSKYNLFLELVFDPDKKGFFSVSKKETPSDYFEGNLVQVTPTWLEAFIKKKKKEPPQAKQIISTKYKVHGVWCKEVFVDGVKVLDLDRDIGYKLEYEKFMLPSDGNWREDIAYRRLQNISRAQTEKERLEVLQRKDRKLRESVHGKKH